MNYNKKSLGENTKESPEITIVSCMVYSIRGEQYFQYETSEISKDFILADT